MQKLTLRLPAFLRFLLASLLFTALMRFISFEDAAFSNFAPVGALGIFGGACFKHKWKAVFNVVFTLFITNIFINYLYFHKLMLWSNAAIPVYISFVAAVFAGAFINKISIASVGIASLAAVALHWLITDIEPWLNSPYYTKGIAGYVESLIAALPFERNMLLADAAFGALLFGGYAWYLNRNKASRRNAPVAVQQPGA